MYSQGVPRVYKSLQKVDLLNVVTRTTQGHIRLIFNKHFFKNLETNYVAFHLKRLR